MGKNRSKKIPTMLSDIQECIRHRLMLHFIGYETGRLQETLETRFGVPGQRGIDTIAPPRSEWEGYTMDVPVKMG